MLIKLATVFALMQRERFANRRPTSREQLPPSFEAINPAWMTAVLCPDVPGARVTEVTLLGGDSGTTNRQRLGIAYNAEGRAAGLPASVFVKATMSFATRLSAGVTETIAGECEFYNRIRPQLAIEAPNGYFANCNMRSCGAIIILEDLVAGKGAVFCDPATTPVDRARAESIVRLLAGYHGRYMADPGTPDLAGLVDWEHSFGVICRVARTHTQTLRGLMAGDDLLPARIRDRAKDVWTLTQQSTELGRATPKTLMHGDVHIKNWYITNGGAGDMGLADWQTATRGPFTRDLVYAITTSLTIEDRRRWERELIGIYLDRLAEISGVTLPFDATFDSYRQQLTSALAFWTPTLRPPAFFPAMQPEALSREYIHRLTTAMDDLDTIGAIEQGIRWQH